jgi:hypothetical protein
LKDLNKPGNNPKDLAKGFVGLATGILGAVSAAIAFGKALKDIFGKDRAKEEVGSIAKEFGEIRLEGVRQAIEDLAKNKFGGNRQAAKIFDLDQIISQGGGITAKNLGVLEDRLHDVFSLLQTGACHWRPGHASAGQELPDLRGLPRRQCVAGPERNHPAERRVRDAQQGHRAVRRRGRRIRR